MTDTILVTGAAGVIGFHVSLKPLQEYNLVVSINNLNDYYDASLKTAHLKILKYFNNLHFIKEDTSNKIAIEKIW